jgi:CO/xanthine dehydrogenase Mo-binding subunit
VTLSGLAAADPMRDAIDRVSGRTRYAIDVALPGMAHVALVRSPVAAGRLLTVDPGAARQAPGVVRIVDRDDLIAAGLAAVRFGTMERDQPLLAVERVSHVGEIVAAVIAETVDDARSAAALVRLEIEPESAVFDPDAALEAGAPTVRYDRADRTDNVLVRWGAAHGDLAVARERAAHRYRHEFSTPAAQVASLEPHVCLATWQGDRLEVWTTSQAPSRVAQELARVFGLETDAVRLRVPPLGGAYGGKNHAKQEPLVAFLARLAGRPVRLANRREDEFVTVTRHPAKVLVESGVGEDGRFVYRTARLRWSGGAYALSSGAVVRTGGMAVLGPYRIPAAEVESVVAYTNLPPAGSFRGLGVNQAAWAGEQQIDIIAADLGLDPVEFRRRNLALPGDRLWTGEPAGHVHWLECLERAVADLDAAVQVTAEIAGTGSVAEPVADEGSIRRGRGVAVVMKQTITPSRAEALVVLRRDGVVEVRTSGVDMGQGAPTVLTRIAGRVLGVGFDRLVPVLPDTARTPFDVTSSASRVTSAVGGAVALAASDLLERVLEGASVALGVPPDQLRRDAGRTIAADGRSIDDGAVVAAVDVAELAGGGVYVNPAPLDPETGKAATTSHWHQGALAVEVAIDIGTGVVRVERAHGAAWAGEVISVAGARLQNEGNVVFGIGSALFERLEFDAAGRPSPLNLLDYRLPSTLDLPWTFTTEALEAGPTERGEPHGLGESLIAAVAPAIGNAVAALTGARIVELPLSPERVLAALANARVEGPG